MKVGKAIYNILSKSTDVQSNFPFNTTDYAPTGTELVTNGDFANTTAGNIVLNPNFTDGVSITIANHNFATGTTSGWSTGRTGDGVTPYVVADGANYGALISNGVLDGSSNISQNTIFEVGKSYKITYRIISNANSNELALQGYDSLTSTVGTHTLYIVGVVTREDLIIKANGAETSTAITDIVVEELGVDWSITNDDRGSGYYVDYTSTGAHFVAATDDPILRTTSAGAILESGKSYKLTVDITVNSGAVKFSKNGVNESFSATTLGTNNTRYIVPTSDVYVQFYRGAASADVNIHSVSVELLGEGWTLGTGATVGDSKLVLTNGSGTVAYQPSIINATTTHRISFTVSNYVQGNIRGRVSNVNGALLTGDGDKVQYITGLSGTNTGLSCTSSFIGDVTNISVQEMILTKIFPELAPPDIDAPYIVYSVVSNSPSETKNANGDIDTANIEVYGFQDTYNKAVDLGVSVRAALDRKTGTYNTIQIQSTNYVNEQMDVNEARKLWAAIQDYSIRIKNI